MSSEIPWLPLEDLVEDILDRRGVTPLKLGGDFTKAGHRVISAKLLKAGRVDLHADEPRYVNAVVYAKWMKGPLLRGDVLMTSEAPLGELAYVNETLDWCLGQRLFAIRPKKLRLDGCYAYYALQLPKVREDLLGRATGTTVQGIRQSELRRVKVPVPDLRFQAAAAATLKAIDDRIALLRETNATLEAIAQALFRSWFVDFDPVRAKSQGLAPAGMDEATAALFPDGFEEAALGSVPIGWKVVSVEDVAERVGMGPFGSNIKVSTFVEEGVPVVSGAHLHGTLLEDLQFNFITEEHAARLKNSCVFAGDVVFTHAGSIGQVALVPAGAAYIRYVLSQRQFYLRCNLDRMRPAWMTYFFRSPKGQHLLLANASQVGVPSIARPVSYLRSIQFALPQLPLIARFSEAVDDLHASVVHNRERIRTLTIVRDTLLPRLISGQLRLAETEKAKVV